MHGRTPTSAPANRQRAHHEVNVSRTPLVALAAAGAIVVAAFAGLAALRDDDTAGATISATDQQSTSDNGDSESGDPSTGDAATSGAATDGAAVAADATGRPQLDAEAYDPVLEAEAKARDADAAVIKAAVGGCTVSERSIAEGDNGESVSCIQRALAAAGTYAGEITGTFDAATAAAASTFQRAKDLYIDGIVGGQTAQALGIWPGDEFFVVRTPVPAPGATDLWGMPLSSVASAGSGAPPMPENTGQGTGKRIVYDRASLRVWAVDDSERVVRSYLVTGSQYNNELPGLHEVYSRSEVSTAWNGKAYLPLMVRWLDTERGAIGFHGIPTHVEDGSPYQTEAELGQRLSGGCQRQANPDAQFMWAFGQIGTPVYVT